MYLLVDDLGEVLDGAFYEPESQKVLVPTDKLYHVELVLQRQNVGRRTGEMIQVPLNVHQLDRRQGPRWI